MSLLILVASPVLFHKLCTPLPLILILLQIIHGFSSTFRCSILCSFGCVISRWAFSLVKSWITTSLWSCYLKISTFIGEILGLHFILVVLPEDEHFHSWNPASPLRFGGVTSRWSFSLVKSWVSTSLALIVMISRSFLLSERIYNNNGKVWRWDILSVNKS